MRTESQNGNMTQSEGICLSKLQELELLDANHLTGKANFEFEEICHPKYGKAKLCGSIPLILKEGEFQPHSEESRQRAYNFLVEWLDDHYVDLGTTEERDKLLWYSINGASITFPANTFSLDSPVMYSTIGNWLLGTFIDDLYETTFLTKQMALVGSGSGSICPEIMKPYKDVLQGKYKSFAEIPKFDFPMMQPILELAYLSYEQGQKHRSDYWTAADHFFRVVEKLQDTWLLMADKEFFQRTSIETYSYFRQNDVGGPFYIEVILIANDINLSKAVRKNLVFKRFRSAFSNAMAIENDLLGMQRELDIDEPNNAILRKVNDGFASGYTLQKSGDDAVNSLAAEIGDLVQCGSKLIEQFSDDANVEKLVNRVYYALDGQLRLYTDKHRYGKVATITYNYN